MPAFSSAALPLADLGSSQMAPSGLSQELRAATQAAATEAALAAVRASLAAVRASLESASTSAVPGSASSVIFVPSSVAQDQLHATVTGFLSSGSGLLAWTADNHLYNIYTVFSLYFLAAVNPGHVREGCNTNDCMRVLYQVPFCHL